MRRKYRNCQRTDGNCTLCHLVQDGKDCRGRTISNLERARLSAGMGQNELSAASGVYIRQIQKVESGDAEAGNMAAKNLLALAAALGVDPKNLI